MQDKLSYQYWGKAGSIGNVEIPYQNHRLKGLKDDTDLEASGKTQNSVQSEKSEKSVQSPESVIQTRALKGERQSKARSMGNE